MICDLVQNKAYHVALVYNGNFLKFYRNGYLMSQVAATGNFTPNLAATLIGLNDRISPNTFVGYIDELRVWENTRSQELIKTYMNQTLPTPATQEGLLAYFTFEDRSNAQGDNVHNLTLTPEGVELNVIPENCLFTTDSITVVRSDIKANEDTTICAGSPVQMKVSQGTSFIWTPFVGLSDPLVPNPVASPLTTTKNIVTGIGESMCASSDTVIITVVPVPNAIVSNDTVVCTSATVQLSASGGVNYEWFPSSGLNDANIANPVGNMNSTTIYTVNVKGVNGCVTTETVNVEVRTYPQFISSGNRMVCEGEQVELSASGGTTYQWQPAAKVSDALISLVYWAAIIVKIIFELLG